MLLGWYIFRTNDFEVWINQEQSQDFSIAWSRRVRKLEWGDPMLHHVGEAKKARFASEDFSYILDRGFSPFNAMDKLGSSVIILWIRDTPRAVFCLLAE